MSANMDWQELQRRVIQHAEAIDTLAVAVEQLKAGLQLAEGSIVGIAAHLGTQDREIGELQQRLRPVETANVASPTDYRYVIVSAGYVDTLQEIVRDHIRAGWQCQGGIAFGDGGCHQAMVRQ